MLLAGLLAGPLQLCWKSEIVRIKIIGNIYNLKCVEQYYTKSKFELFFIIALL
jgi:hypothetical protein